jgi:hypothetical protein
MEINMPKQIDVKKDGTIIPTLNHVEIKKLLERNELDTYESDWFKLNQNGSYTLIHDLNYEPETQRVTLLCKVVTAIAGFSVGDIFNFVYTNICGVTSSVDIGFVITPSQNQLIIGSGNATYFCGGSKNGTMVSIPYGNVQFKAIIERVASDNILWESSWFNIAASGYYDFTHNANVDPERQKWDVLFKVKTANSGWSVGEIIDPSYFDLLAASSTGDGSTLWLKDANSVRLAFSTSTRIGGVAKYGSWSSLLKSYFQCKLILTATAADKNIWESDWFNMPYNAINILTHNLNVIPEKQKVKLLCKFKSTSGAYNVGDIVDIKRLNYGGGTADLDLGCMVYLSNNQMRIIQGNNETSFIDINKSGGYTMYTRSVLQMKAFIEY